MNIRTATMNDLDAITALEALCFPKAEAADKKSFEKRLLHYPDCFWLLFEGEQLISFIDGFATDEEILTDEMFAHAQMHNPTGMYQMIFGVVTHPNYRNQGYASKLMRRVIKDCKARNKKGIILTCKEEKIGFYQQFGYQNQGVSGSNHGAAKWYQMILPIA